MVGTDRQSQLTTKSEKQAGDGEAGDVYPAHITYTNRQPATTTYTAVTLISQWRSAEG